MRTTVISGLRRAGLVAALAASSIACGGVALAQKAPYERQDQGYQAGVFDYYVLALSWSPTYCAGLQDGRYDPQCHSREGRRYAFVLHGLWPQFEQRWPQYCKGPDNGYVPGPVADRMLDIMPSKKLIFHEYRKHGTCSGLGVDGYFDLARRMFSEIKIPPRYVALEDDRLTVSPEELKREFMAANPKLAPDMFVVECGGAGNRLKEVRVCFNKGGGLRACGRNEDQRRLCAAERMYVPPVRIGGVQMPPTQQVTPAPPTTPTKRQAPAKPVPEGELLPGPR